MFSISHSPTARTVRTGAMTRVVCALTLAFAATFASGCALLSDSLEKAAKAGGKVVKEYCENVTLPEVRDQIRDAVNAKAAPHKVEVTCADETPAPAPAPPTGSVLPTPAETVAWKWSDFAPSIVIHWLDRAPIIIIEKS